MKRAIFQTGATRTLAVVLAMLAAGCSGRERAATSSRAQTSGWVAPPVIDTATRAGAGLTVIGHAQPQGRVVLRAEGGVAYAIGADAGGRFELTLQIPAVDTLFVVETQVGQDALPAPYRLLAGRDPGGPLALVAAGTSSRRLDSGGALDTVDSDGRKLLLSGRAAVGAVVPVTLDGRPAGVARTGSDGRWTFMAPGEARAVVIRVGDRTYAYRGPDLGGQGLVLTSVPGGWRASWTVSDASRQGVWFPNAG